VVVGAGGRQTARLGDDIVVLLQEGVEEGALGIACDGAGARLRDVVMRGSDPLLEDAAPVLPERHAEVLEVPQDRS